MQNNSFSFVYYKLWNVKTVLTDKYLTWCCLIKLWQLVPITICPSEIGRCYNPIEPLLTTDKQIDREKCVYNFVGRCANKAHWNIPWLGKQISVDYKHCYWDSYPWQMKKNKPHQETKNLLSIVLYFVDTMQRSTSTRYSVRLINSISCKGWWIRNMFY